MRRPPRVGFYGVLGSGNLGNDGSLDVLVSHLRTRHPDIEIGFMGMGPDRLRERYGAPATPLQWYEAHLHQLACVPTPLLKIIGRLLDPVRTLRWVLHYDFMVVPGMGVLEAATPTRPFGFPYGLFWACLTARLVGCRVALVCVGADEIRSPVGRWLIIRAARMAQYRSYRDEHSRMSMRSMGVDVSADAVYPDLAFVHPAPQADSGTPGAVGLGVMAYRGNSAERHQSAELHRRYIEVMTRFAGWLVDRGRPVRLYACDPEDHESIDAVLISLRATRPGLDPAMAMTVEASTLQELMQRMAGLDAVVATRYHNVIGAVLLALPTVSISYADKHDVVMRRAGLSEFCQPARSIDFDRLVTQFTALEARRAELVPAMRLHNQATVDGVEEQLAAFSSLIEAWPTPVTPRSALRA